MAIDIGRTRRHLQDFDFKKLFVEELGWDRYRARPLEVAVDGTSYILNPIAEKRGFQVWECGPDADGAIPDQQIRMKVDREVAKTAFEHLIVFTDQNQTMQTWQWGRREADRPLALRQDTFAKGQSGERLVQKLSALVISIEDEERLTLTDVNARVRGAFDVDRVTKRFYDRFKAEHAAFLQFVQGIADQGDREWYASLMLNRLMFVYFIQKKGFLDGDANYLRNRLKSLRMRNGGDKFLSFYRHFLLRLFHEGLGQQARSSDLDALLGTIPYLNGGLFDVHDLERNYEDIQIPDEAFEKIFDFFDAYQWHLDERPLRADNEINPDVLGYIFEKYINQKQMGAYYTKEDITEYIGKNTIIPFLFDAAKKECHIAFDPASLLWSLLREDPDRYIYDAVLKGLHLDLPTEIAAGVGDVSKRGGWNKLADPAYALPTETWREQVARRNRIHEIRAKLRRGEVHEINDLITYNLDIRQFAQDAVQWSEGPELVRAFYHAIEQVSILDPTCGSGAFLFAALNVLEPIYEACLDRMQGFVDDADRSEEWHSPEKFSDFRKILERVKQHPNRRYFILKSIIIGNLFGVDIMEEAVEICKLRLFLKLVAQVERVDQIEPLPDIDFNIRAGNTLVGFATYDEVKRAVTAKLDFDNVMQRIDRQAGIADHAFKKFREMQTQYDLNAKDFAETKRELREQLKPLEEELNKYLALEYSVYPAKQVEYEKWRQNHRPFHWFVEFYGIMKRDGFDVIVGNPPYVEYSKIRKEYTVKYYETIEANNLFPFVMERCIRLSNERSSLGLIVQLSAFSTPRMVDVNSMINDEGLNYISFFECRPGKLFEGIDVRLSIWLRRNSSTLDRSYTTRLCRFPSDFRPFLMQTLEYTNTTTLVEGHVTPKLSTSIERSIYGKLVQHKPTIGGLRVETGSYRVYYSYGVRYWARVLNTKPYYRSDTTDVSTGEKTLDFQDPFLRNAIVCIMTSSLFFWFYCVTSDGHNFTKTVIDAFPVGKTGPETLRALDQLCSVLMDRLESTAFVRRASYKTTGNIEYKEYDVSSAKDIIDGIDAVLAKHYGFTDEELDFIINYDIKYRMGRDAEDAEE